MGTLIIIALILIIAVLILKKVIGFAFKIAGISIGILILVMLLGFLL